MEYSNNLETIVFRSRLPHLLVALPCATTRSGDCRHERAYTNGARGPSHTMLFAPFIGSFPLRPSHSQFQPLIPHRAFVCAVVLCKNEAAFYNKSFACYSAASALSGEHHCNQ